MSDAGTRQASIALALWLALHGLACGSVESDTRGAGHELRLPFSDLATNVGARRGQRAVRVEVQYGALSRAAWLEAMRVVAWPERDTVPGHFELVEGEIVSTFVFAADTGLEDRWYALQIDFALLRERTRADYATYLGPPTDGRRHTFRFRFGSQRIVRVGGVILEEPVPDGEVSEISLRMSEAHRFPVLFEASRDLVVSANGERIHCEGAVSDQLPDHVRCDHVPPASQLEMSFTSEFLDRAGPLYDTLGQSPPRWSFWSNASIERPPADTLFAP